MSETQKSGTTTLFRVENPVHPKPRKPDGLVSHEDVIGQWFTPDLDTALGYLRKSTQTFGVDAHPVDGSQLVVAHVPNEQLDTLHVSRHPIAAGMDVEPDNFLLPRDGSIPMDVVPLDDTLEDLRGQLGNLNTFKEAQERVHALLGETALK